MAGVSNAAVLVSGSYTQDFNSYEGTQSSLPTGWALNFSAEETHNGTLTRSLGFSGDAHTDILNTTGGSPRGVWAARDNETSEDYHPTMTFNGTNRNTIFVLSLTNDDSFTWTEADVSFAYKQITEGLRAATGSFSYSTDNGANWLTSGDIANHTTTVNTEEHVFLSDTVVTPRSGLITDLSVLPSETLMLRWNLNTSAGDGRNSMLGFDDVNVVVIPEPGTLLLLGIALGTLALFHRRR
ncbi:MAG: PEP-CTERM sorting domain-containing protein [Kiritimatiellae bacterium]|nr:PEP-CTERM sorting domain-containing protein [Kiritimatiellia bacterium]